MAVMVMNFRKVLYEKTHVNVLGDEKSYLTRTCVLLQFCIDYHYQHKVRM